MTLHKTRPTDTYVYGTRQLPERLLAPQAAIKQDDHAVVVEETAHIVVGLKGLGTDFTTSKPLTFDR